MPPSRNTKRIRISLNSGAGARRSPAGFAGSFALHAAIFAAALIGWQHRIDLASDLAPVVPVDLVTIADRTNIAPAERPAPKVLPQEPVPQSQPEKLINQPPALPQEQAEQAPSEPVIKPVPAPALPKAKPQTRPKKSFDVDSVLALLNKVAPAQSAAHSKAGPQTRKGVGAQTAMTADLVDALRSQIYRCWSPPVGAPNPAELVVNYDLFLNPDGSVAQSPLLDAKSRAAEARGDSYTQAADDAAQRAIYTCAPYKLPVDRYAQWREINPFTFDPRQMMGQ
jgi:outer membrane biosynthesis protein TonB